METCSIHSEMELSCASKHQNQPGLHRLPSLRDAKVPDRLANAAVPSPGVKYKVSTMPFVQRENISHFLRAVQAPPLALPDHDIFLTVDLYESKDPTQVLQCLSAFSRRANVVQPSKFPRTLGPKARTGPSTPQGAGISDGWKSPGKTPRPRVPSNASQTSTSTATTGIRSGTDLSSVGAPEPAQAAVGRTTNSSPRGAVSSWSKKSDEGTTTPAWNIYQYGYLGGASQGKQGISFGATRQITGSNPVVPSWSERERKKREEESEREEVERGARLEREAEEKRKRVAEEQRQKEETRRRREREQAEVEAEKARWEEQERKWREDEEQRIKAEKETEARLEAERQRASFGNDSRLQGQLLSQYLSEQNDSPKTGDLEQSDLDRERGRVRQLEQELELAKARERQYEAERQQQRHLGSDAPNNDRSANEHSTETGTVERASIPDDMPEVEGLRPDSAEDRSREKERIYLQDEWNAHHLNSASNSNSQTIPTISNEARPLPELTSIQNQDEDEVPMTPYSIRPLPDPTAYAAKGNRIERFLTSNQTPTHDPTPTKPTTHLASGLSFDTSAAERHVEDIRREQSQIQTKAGGWASKSLLEREMELERQRQQEWEEAQQRKVTTTKQVGVERGGNFGGAGPLGAGGLPGGEREGGRSKGTSARRSVIIGPRPPP